MKKIENTIKCDCGGEYLNRGKCKHIKTMIHQNFILKNQRTINCECGGSFTSGGERQHSKTKIHQKFLNKNLYNK
jgi:acetone carboxylase gamma subunit